MSRYLRFALVGDPVGHSLSPMIQRAALEVAGLAGDYQAIMADVEVLDRVVDDLRSGRLDGVNVTMPLKLVARERSDRLTEHATKAGSVNTLRAREGQVEAHSTDVVAFEEILSRFPQAERILILGAGGSARAALAAWNRGPVHLSARDPARAVDLGSRIGPLTVVPWGEAVSDALVVNATPLGMGGESLPSPVVEAAIGLVDLPYSEQTTPAVTAATEADIFVVDGIEFLAMQASASFQWWTGVVVDSQHLASVARNG